MPVTPVGATDDEVNAIPVRILGGLVKNSACTAVTSEGTGGSEVVGDTQCCPICLVDFGMGDTVLEFPGCEHCYHRACLVEWLKVSRKCPTCRRELV
ncbi:hypothetical protein BC830DRAFT_1066857 [Chytriomyces sp. MP71]|nr:hypothetical protein BC830DRAFT_1066857 [Chytriomyces sp. MP71]